MNKAVLKLETLTCPSCLEKIEGALKNSDGVDSVKVLFNSSKAKVSFDESVVSTDELKNAVEKVGYEVKKVKAS